jgi:hypothetical protein
MLLMGESGRFHLRVSGRRLNAATDALSLKVKNMGHPSALTLHGATKG